MNWKKSEERAYEWFKENIDVNAIKEKAADSTVADIYSPLLSAYVEVKDISNGARCGQFTESTMKDNPHSELIYNGDFSEETSIGFAKYHYEKKGVKHFIVVENGSISFYNGEDFFNTYKISVQTPYKKRSGTRSAPKKDIPLLLEFSSNFVLNDEDGRVYCTDPSQYGKYISLHDFSDYFISKTKDGEVRKRSSTNNMTWHILVESRL